MPTTQYRFQFAPAVPIADAEMTLHLAIAAVEGLYGQARVRLDVAYRLDAAGRALHVDASTMAGAALVGIFTALALKEFGEDGVVVGRASYRHPGPEPGPAAEPEPAAGGAGG